MLDGAHPAVHGERDDLGRVGVGANVQRVVATGLLPIIDTSITHRTAGYGMIVAGLVNPPREYFAKALEAFAARYGGSGA